ncbi:hypothetical protein PMAYCL1PPCAC_05088 [Pristionchus mayeri]|uniref:Uncharacterized protein n=1 Tax=Pristionchus mayeri TaxID=1317129 RepID=A0AAN5C2T2_9BILA|nr:hypothetical protein PMAYCL1PPCAC_05088 [Pristionchus mayeri]
MTDYKKVTERIQFEQSTRPFCFIILSLLTRSRHHPVLPHLPSLSKIRRESFSLLGRACLSVCQLDVTFCVQHRPTSNQHSISAQHASILLRSIQPLTTIVC